MVQFVVESEESELLTMNNVELKIQPLINLTVRKVVTKLESFTQYGSGFTLQSVNFMDWDMKGLNILPNCL